MDGVEVLRPHVVDNLRLNLSDYIVCRIGIGKLIATLTVGAQHSILTEQT